MIPVSLKKVERQETALLQEMVTVYSTALQAQLTPQLSFKFYDQMLEVQILRELWFLFRKKIEGRPAVFTLSLEVSQAVVLIYAMSHCRDTDNDYAKIVITKYCNAIDKDLHDRIILKAQEPEGPIKLLTQPTAV